MNRVEFLTGIAAAAAAPSPSPAPKFSLDDWDKSDALPYDRPIDFTMELLDAGRQQFKLSDYRGRAVLFNIFATWCGPCNHEQPHVVDISTKYASQGLAVIGMDSKESDDQVRAYRKKYGITYPIAMDRQGGFVLDLENNAGAALVDKKRPIEEFPVSLFFDPRGYLYGVRIGSMSAVELDHKVQKFLADVAGALRSPAPDALNHPNR